MQLAVNPVRALLNAVGSNPARALLNAVGSVPVDFRTKKTIGTKRVENRRKST